MNSPERMSIICGGSAQCVTARWSAKLRSCSRARSVTTRSGVRWNSRRASTLVVRASDNAPESSTMDYQGALRFLGLNDSASSEDMVRAKNQMMSRYREEEEKLKKVSHSRSSHPRGFRRARKKKMPSWPLPSSGCWRRVLTDFRVSFARALSPCMTHAFHSSQRAQVEAAYDVVLMRSLMKRSQGEVSDNRVKYADVLSPGAVVKKKLPPWARDMSSKLPPRPAVEAPEGEILTQGGIALAVLSVLIIAQGCSQVRFKDLFFPRCERPSRADDTPMLHLPTADS